MRKSPYLLSVIVLTAAACHPHAPTVAPSTTYAAPVAASAAPPRPPAASPPPPPPRAATPRPTAPPLSEEEVFGRKSLDQLNAERPLMDAFFEYDQADLREDARTALQKDAAWLSKWTQTAIRVEGYCDERGTPEYNLSLGDRRASAVKTYLESLGVSPSRINIISLGEERRFCDQSTDDCWAKNRRGHFVLTAK